MLEMAILETHIFRNSWGHVPRFPSLCPLLLWKSCTHWKYHTPSSSSTLASLWIMNLWKYSSFVVKSYAALRQNTEWLMRTNNQYCVQLLTTVNICYLVYISGESKNGESSMEAARISDTFLNCVYQTLHGYFKSFWYSDWLSRFF